MKFYLLLFSSLFLTACLKSPDSGGGTSTGGINLVAESSYCSTVTSVTTPTTITAQAQFYQRALTSSGLGTASTAVLVDIPYAEVVVYNSAGKSIQCGETDGSGQISLQIPKTAGTYTLQVNSRSDNSQVKASVLDNPQYNRYYKIQASFTLTSSDTAKAVTLNPASIGSGSSAGPAGAFNILYQIWKANEFLRNNTSCTNCTSVSVAPKVKVFWTPGLSPGYYYGDSSVGISFYSKDDVPASSIAKGLYVLGGIQGDLNCTDSDQFDNSIILHEYAHFLEDSFAGSDSPGGSHTGNSLIDPRLAWSEGWANFFQAAVMSSDTFHGWYVDTVGNADCSTSGSGISIALDLEKQTSGQDIPNYTNQGIFREVSISRTLWDIFTTSAESDFGSTTGADDGFNTGLTFGPIWEAFSSTTAGLAISNIAFRNMGLLNYYLTAYTAANYAAESANLASVLSNEMQPASEIEYAVNLTTTGSGSCTSNIPGTSTTFPITLTGVASESIQRSNDYYEYDYDGSSATATIKLKYTTGTSFDIDMFVFKKEYDVEDSSTIVAYSNRNYPESGGSESVSLLGQPSGKYMILISSKSDSVSMVGRSSSYHLENATGAWLCP